MVCEENTGGGRTVLKVEKKENCRHKITEKGRPGERNQGSLQKKKEREREKRKSARNGKGV